MASGLATRCGACGTVFRVVPDQLRVSEGWVRCGRCSEVFNAAEALLDLETGAPRRLPAEMVLREPPPPAPIPAPPPPAPPPPMPADFRLDIAPHAPARPNKPEPEPADSESNATTMPVVDDAASRFAAYADEQPDPRAEPEDRPAEQPAFVRQAERAARWRQPRVRAALLALALLGVLGLATQVLYEYRDLAAARWATLRPALEQACGALGCRIGAARSINDLAVESSGLVRVEKSSIYKLAVGLRNRGLIEVALPALELSLTDSQGQLIARRVLNAAELGVNQATLAAGRDLTLQATLQAALKPEATPVAGYTIELFYP